jgi:hypothetical protein
MGRRDGRWEGEKWKKWIDLGDIMCEALREKWTKSDDQEWRRAENRDAMATRE